MKFPTLLLLSLSAALTASAQSSTSTGIPPQSSAITPASSINATIFSGDSTYAYYGCYNETTTLPGTAMTRALTGGPMAVNATISADVCLRFCKANGADMYAGLEYTRECYCASSLSAVSAKLPDSACNLACEGNTSQICGGSLVISVYQKVAQTSSKKGAAARMGASAPVLGSAVGLTLAFAVLLCWF